MSCSSYFHSLTAYVFGAFLLAFVGFGSMLYNLQAAVSNFEYVLSFGSLVFVVIVPILTMRVIAEERKQKTDQLLYSLPITATQVVLGKYLALLVVCLPPMAIISLYPLIFSQFGDVSLTTAYGSLVAFYIMGAALIALGVFISSLTDNPGFRRRHRHCGDSSQLLQCKSLRVRIRHRSRLRRGPGHHRAAAGAGDPAPDQKREPGLLVLLLPAVRHMAVYIVDSTVFEGLLPEIMKKLSLFERFNSFVNGSLRHDGYRFLSDGNRIFPLSLCAIPGKKEV